MMNKFFPILALLMFLGLPLSAQYRNLPGSLEDSPTVSAMKRHVSSLAAAQMEGRAPGSEGEKMAAAYLREQFELEGIDVLPDMTFGISEGADTLVSLNVAGFIPGNDRKDRYIVIGARIDNLGQDTYTVNGQTQSRTYYGANGNASGMAMLLELGSRLSLSRGMLSRSVLLVGFGSSGKTLAGSWYMLNGGFADASAIDAMINLDILGGGADSFGIYTAGCRDLETVALAMEGELLPVRASLLDAEPYSGDHLAFYQKEIPAALFTTGRYPEHGTSRDTFSIVDFEGMEKELEYIFSYALRLCNGRTPLFRNSAASTAKPVGVYSYADVDTKPMFFNSPDPSAFMEKWVYQYLKYPSYAVENGIQGRVIVDFVINEKGDVTDVKVTRGVHVSLDREAERIVSASPRWKPGRRQGKKVKVAMTVAVDFRLEKNRGRFGINGKKL